MPPVLPFTRRRSPLALVVPVLAVALAGCSSDEEVPYAERPAEDIYGEAVSALGEHDYRQAARLYDEVERQHPYSSWATRAQLMSAYAQYQGLHYDEAIIALDNFIRLHPGSENIAYA